MSDDQIELGSELGHSLSTMDVPPSRLDIQGTVRQGRRRVRKRRLVAVCTSAVLIAAIPLGIVAVRNYFTQSRQATPLALTTSAVPGVTPGAATVARIAGPCAVQALTIPQLPDGVVPSDVYDMDPSGRYIVAQTYLVGHDTSTAGILWDNGVPSILPALTRDTFPTSVNARGEVAGWGARDNAGFYVWVYRKGALTELPSPAGFVDFMGNAWINAAGDVLGEGISTDRLHIEPIIWPAASPNAPRVVKAPRDSGVKDQVLSARPADDGSVVGTIGSRLDERPYRWASNGTGKVLALPAGFGRGGVSGVRGAIAFGWVGQRGSEVGQRLALWDLRTGDVTLMSADLRGELKAADANGDVIISATPGPAYVSGGKPVVLADLTKGSTPNPVQVNEDGTIVVGNAYTNPTDPHGIRQPVIWRCNRS